MTIPAGGIIGYCIASAAMLGSTVLASIEPSDAEALFRDGGFAVFLGYVLFFMIPKLQNGFHESLRESQESFDKSLEAIREDYRAAREASEQRTKELIESHERQMEKLLPRIGCDDDHGGEASRRVRD